MAVVDKYANNNVALGKLANPAFIQGGDTLTLIATVAVAAADDDGSIYRLGVSLNPNLIPISIVLNNDTITGGTDYELGLYVPGLGGEAKDIDVFLGTTSMATGRATGSELNALTAVAHANKTKKLYEHAGDTVDTKQAGYDLALTANTVGTAAGSITVTAQFIQG